MREGFVNNGAFTLTNAIIIDPSSNYEGTASITIEDGVISSINGKVELVYEGEEEGAEQVSYNLISSAVKSIFNK